MSLYNYFIHDTNSNLTERVRGKGIIRVAEVVKPRPRDTIRVDAVGRVDPARRVPRHIRLKAKCV